MKRRNNNHRCGIKNIFPVTSVQVSLAIGRMTIISVLFFGMVLISPVGISQAHDEAAVKYSNLASFPAKPLKTIIVGDYYPYTFVNEKGIPDGFSVDIAKAVTKVMDCKLEISVDTWENATKALANGTIDLLPMMAASRERDVYFDFSVPHTIAYDAIFVRSGEHKVSSLNSLAGKTVIIMNQDAAHDYLLKSGVAAKMKLVLIDSLPGALRALAEGKADAALMPKLVGLIVMKKLNLTNLDPSPVVINAYARPFCFAVKDGNQPLLERLSQGLSIIKSSGQYQEIYQKWFGAVESSGLSWEIVIKYIGVISAVFLLIGLVLILWNASLRKQVSLRTKHLADEIKKREQAEDVLQQSEEKYRLIIENANEAIYVLQDEIFLYVNRICADILGVPAAELIGLSMLDFLSPDDREKAISQHLEMLRSEQSTGRSDFRVRTRHGEEWWADVNSVTITWEGKTATLNFATDITDRKRAEEALQKSEENYRLLFENAGEGILIAQGDMIKFANPALIEIIGYSRDIITTRPFSSFILPEDNPMVVDRHKRRMRGESIETGYDFRIITAKGTVSWLHIISQVISWEGTPASLSFVTNINERKQAEERISEIARRLELATTSAKAGVWDWNLQTNEMIWDDRMLELYGLTRESFPGGVEAWEQGLHPDDSARAMEDCQVALRGERDFDTEFRVLHPDGTVIHIKANGLVIRDEEGKPLRMIGLNTDITDRKKVEEDLLQENIFIGALFESIPGMIYVYDEQGNHIRHNIKHEKMTGYSAEELSQMNPLSWYDDKADIVRVEAAINDVWETGYGEVEVPMRIKNGEKLFMHFTGSRLIREGKKYFIGVGIDITDRKRAEDEKKNFEERLQRAEKMESLGLLAGGVAHDLNNVLGIVVGYAEMVLSDIDKSNPLRNDLLTIMDGGQRAAAIVQDLLTLARRGVTDRKVLNLNKIILDYKKSPEWNKLSSNNQSIQIQIDLEPDLLNISASSVHLEKTLLNLIANASEAMSKGGTLTITTANQYLDKPVHGYEHIREGDYVVLTVTDTGEGIQAKDLKRIFEPFYTKKIMGRSGTGLGLSVVWGTVKDHHGYINVESEKGRGTTFTLYFPVAREDITAESSPLSISEYMGNDESILIVDDVKGQRDLASAMLKKLNYNVSVAASGEEAVEYLKEHQVDLVVLDMIMDPGMDGLDTYESILAIHPKQKAIIVSGFSESDRVNEAHALGAGAYVKKPYVREKLGLAVKNELARK